MAVLRQSRWDAIPIALSVVHGAALFLAPSIPVVAIALWWNSNTVSHNFIHLPFFRAKTMNSLYSIYLTLLLGIPQSLWRWRHLAHHKGIPVQLRWTPAVVCETLLVLGLWAILFWLAPGFFATVYLPGYLIGLELCYVHGYFEHAPDTTSHYGLLYNIGFLNDGYHVEHHARPGDHWTRLPLHKQAGGRTSRIPAILRWLEVFNLEMLERAAIRSTILQRFLLKTHERAIRVLLERTPDVRRVTIVGGGMFPRTAIILQKLLPAAEIRIVDASSSNLATARRFLDEHVQLIHGTYEAGQRDDADLVVFPLAFNGSRKAIYARPSGRVMMVHDWIWSRHDDGVAISWALLKRLNLVRP
jgi:Fatty acid desaturase